jgi:Lon protease-like protein
VVLLPHSWLPLHIFEQRYRQMTDDALEGDGRIAMVLPRSTDSFEPPIYDVACVGRIVNEQRLADGRYLFLLHGEQRMRLVRECETEKLYRVAEAVPMTEVMDKAMQARRKLQRAEIMKKGQEPVADRRTRSQAVYRLSARPLQRRRLCGHHRLFDADHTGAKATVAGRIERGPGGLSS